MPRYRRYFVPGGTYFFTVVTLRRRDLFNTSENRSLLGKAMRECQSEWPFEVNAIVVLPDHLHAIWTLPRGDDRYSMRWSMIKRGFTHAFLRSTGVEWRVTSGSANERRRGVWQRRFWEHTVRDEDDFERCMDYIHFNPVKHGLTSAPKDWTASSFHRWVKEGVYDINWGGGSNPPKFDNDDFGEPI